MRIGPVHVRAVRENTCGLRAGGPIVVLGGLRVERSVVMTTTIEISALTEIEYRGVVAQRGARGGRRVARDPRRGA